MHTELNPRKEFYIHLTAVVSCGVAAYYLFWRTFYTLNIDALWFSIPLLAAEVYGVISAYMFFFMVWTPTIRTSPPPLKDRTVDIFIATYNEDITLLRKTILGAIRVTYPHKTYVLDDGNRPEVAKLAAELGAYYAARETNTHAKAGNLNNALSISDGEFIVSLDADHVPLPNFIDRTLGYFEDEAVAFVQTPQAFYNLDSFQHRFDPKQRRMWTEQSLFFSVIQPGKDFWNAAFYCGSCAMIRRNSLEAIGGFATGTITEDIHTSIRLHAKGFKSIYHNESLAYGIAAQTALPFYIQRLRWGQGAMQVMRKENPLFIRGLSIPQRICYFASMSIYFDGFQKLIYYLSPAIYLLTSILPINSFDMVFLSHFLPYFVLFLISFELISRGHGSTVLTEQYNMSKFYIFMKSFKGFFSDSKTKFRVTPKAGSSTVSYAMVAPQLFVLGINIGGITWGAWKLSLYNEFEKSAFFGNVFWGSWNVGLAAVASNYIIKKVQKRNSYRFPYLSMVSYKLFDGTKTVDEGVGIMRDYNEYGFSLLLWKTIPTETQISAKVSFYGSIIEAEGVVTNVMRLNKEGQALFQHGIRFLDLKQDDQDMLIRHGIEFAIPKLVAEHDRTYDFFTRIEVFWKKRRRKSERLFLTIPTRLDYSSGPAFTCITEDISVGGFSLLSPKPVDNAEICRLSLMLPDRAIEGKARVVKCTKLTYGDINIYKIVLSFIDMNENDLASLIGLSRAVRLSPL